MPEAPPVAQAVILAAGEGRRLRPLTLHTPKPLLPFLGVPLLDHAAAQVVATGVRRVAVNAHHHAEAVAARVRDVLAPRWPDVAWHVSVERPLLLGTGGALRQLAGWLGRAPFLVVNADAVFGDVLAGLLAAHAAGGADATWLVTRDPAAADLRTVRVEAGGALGGVAPSAEPDAAAFCGVHMAGPGLLDTLPDGVSCAVRDGYLPWQARGATVRVHETGAFWADTGTPERYVDAHRRGLAEVPFWRRLGLFDEAGEGPAGRAAGSSGAPGPRPRV